MVEVRERSWGAVHVVRPGIGVEVANGQDETFPGFVAGALEQVRGVPVGGDLVDAFAPDGDGAGFRCITDPGSGGGEGGAYHGVTLLFQQSVALRPRIGAAKPPAIETKAVGGRRDDGTRVFEAPWIPCVRLPGRPAEGSPVMLGEGREMHHDGVVNPDFAGKADFGLVVFHEMCHAYYDQAGAAGLMSGRAAEFEAAPGHRVADFQNYAEEILVCGLLQGKGLKYCENTYRRQKGLPPRPAYSAVGLKDDPDLAAFAWPSGGPDAPFKEWKAVLRELNFSTA
ncbi:hypothetical protein [Actinorugispora endophytica]|nr:hypothetical protein [Actinorugispora endophytica]